MKIHELEDVNEKQKSFFLLFRKNVGVFLSPSLPTW